MKYLIMVDELTPYKNLLRKINFPNADLIEFSSLDSALVTTEKKIDDYDKIVFINADGIIPFMYFSKIKGIVAAAVYDEHSAYMTPLHNNSKILCSGFEIVSLELMESMIKKYFATGYEGARHKSRIDMLDKLTEME